MLNFYSTVNFWGMGCGLGLTCVGKAGMGADIVGLVGVGYVGIGWDGDQILVVHRHMCYAECHSC